jgi:hypothetical protein
VRVEQSRFEAEHNLADGGEAEVAGLDHARVNRSNWDLDNPVTAQAIHRRHRAVARRNLDGRVKVLSQREDSGRPPLVEHHAAWIRVALRYHAEQVLDLALIPVRGR